MTNQTPVTEPVTEAELQASAVAPRVTDEMVEAFIVRQNTFTAAEGAHATGVPYGAALNYLTICVLTLANGFTVLGQSACASPENFNAEIGARIARENAKSKVWELMGFELRSKLAGL